MYLQTGRFSEALDLLDTPPDHSTFPSMRAEYLATRAIALACLDRGPEALRVAAQAEDLSMSVESRVLAAAAQAVTGAQVGQVEPVVRLFELAEQLSTWDPVVCALRASVQLVQVSSADEVARRKLQDLCQLIDDRALARQANVKIRPVVWVQSALSKRELEILGLIGQGMRNAEIAKALFISESTVKVHVRHILDKLHVRTRAQAAALL
jgi:DNA-binding NarL/FixJ family response regulator